MNQILWELMEMEAPEKFFVNQKEHPAFLAFPKHHYLSVVRNRYNLYMNGVGLIASFGSEKALLERLKRIVENANFPIRVFRMSKHGRKKGQRTFFAENEIQRISIQTQGNDEDIRHVKVFNIKEWEVLA